MARKHRRSGRTAQINRKEGLMGFAAYCDSGGVRGYVRETPAGTDLEFTEHPRDAKEFASQAAITTFLAAHRATTLVIWGGSGTAAASLSHAGKSYANRTP